MDKKYEVPLFNRKEKKKVLANSVSALPWAVSHHTIVDYFPVTRKANQIRPGQLVTLTANQREDHPQ